MIAFAVSEHQDIKEETYKIEALQNAIHSENVLDLRDSTIMNNLNPDILLEKKIEYNEKIIEWQAENKWWKSAIYIPAKVDELELIK